MRNLTKRSTAIATTVVGLIGLGVAFAAWTSTGTGSGGVTAGQAKTLTVTVTNSGDLYPSTSVDVPFQVGNPNSYPVTLSSAKLQNVTVDAGHVGCDPTVVTGPDVALTETVPANGTGVSRPFKVTMSNAATDACQGAIFTVTLKVSGVSG